MDVRGSPPDRIHQHLVDELHHRRVVALGIDPGIPTGAHVLVPSGDVQIPHFIIVVAHRRAERRIAGLPLLQCATDLVLVDQDRLDHQVCMELYVVQSPGLGRVAHPHEQPITALEQGQHLKLLQQFFANQFDCILIRVERGHIKQRHPELHRVGRRKLRSGHQPLL